MAESEFQYHPLDRKRPTPWRGTCEDCGRGIDPGASEPPITVCPLCANVRDVQERLVDLEQVVENLQALLKTISADLAVLKRVIAPHVPGAIAVPVLTGQVKLR